MDTATDTDRPFVSRQQLLSLENRAQGIQLDIDLDEVAERPHVGPSFVDALERYAANGGRSWR